MHHLDEIPDYLLQQLVEHGRAEEKVRAGVKCRTCGAKLTLSNCSAHKLCNHDYECRECARKNKADQRARRNARDREILRLQMLNKKAG